VLSHEIFHALFRRYRDRAPAWARLAHDTSLDTALQILVLNEGIAHFVGRRERLAREGFPVDKATANLAALANAREHLDAKVLTSASRGPFWSKFGSVSGMLFAYAVARARGDDGIREAVRCGPGRLVALYEQTRRELPPLPEQLRPDRWIDLCRR
jgi:hypothetical protein